MNQHRVSQIGPWLIMVGSCVLVLYLMLQVSTGNQTSLFVAAAAILGTISIFRPRVGLYLVVISLILAPSGSGHYIGGYRFTSPSTLLIAGTLAGWFFSVVLYRKPIIFSPSIITLMIVAIVSWIGFWRHGVNDAFNVAYVFSQGVLLYFLALQLFTTTTHIRLFLVALCAGFIIAGAGDIFATIQSVLTGTPSGAIRMEQAIFGTTGGSPTTSSNLRNVILPLFLVGALLSPTLKLRGLLILALLSTAAFMAFSATRQGLIGFALAPALLFFILPGYKRKQLLFVALLGGLMFYMIAVYAFEGWTWIKQQNDADLEILWEGGRTYAWRLGWEAFWKNPLYGHSWGPSHSFLLMHARSMGLLALAPIVAFSWLLWRHTSRLCKQPLNNIAMIYALGVKGGLLMAIIFNVSGRAFATFPIYYFLMLAAIVESIYLAEQKGASSFSGKPASGVEKPLIDSAAYLKTS